MGAIFIATATVRMGQTTRDGEGNIVKHIPPSCEYDPEGSSVIVGPIRVTDDGIEQAGPAEVFGNWDAAGYLAHIMEALKPSRPVNIPDFRKITQSMAPKGVWRGECPFLDHCDSTQCRDCIVMKWVEEMGEGQ